MASRAGRINWIYTCTPLIRANGGATNGTITAVVKCNVDAICRQSSRPASGHSVSLL
jgi:hypothetical protein